ncbi:RING finger protein nhl-1 isoform X2 [Hyalella azteca]|uniref:RING finger protein nhl-1 isoform X2 n=1 Tax=Hyalella azteca TaxID=294128 RepID=A0A8B7P570_HYAAZ|nr:RING finger protein nhl-1 isoform X2 [Hyalella azteca]
MERCAVCNEKNYLAVCAHCEKKVCDACKAAHSDLLKREIGRINNQVKRAAHRLTEQLENVERNIASLKTNTNSITEEIENISKRLQKAIRDRGEYLKSEVQNQYNAEMRHMQNLKEGLDLEIANVQSNIELAEKHMDDETPWDDGELMDTKDIFLKTMEFIRSFDYDTGGEYGRKTRFIPPDDLNKLASSLSNMGELTIPNKHPDSYTAGQSFGSGGLAKSKSDHRLAVQFRDQEESLGGRTSPITRRRFGERPPPSESHDSAYESDPSRRRFRSRFMRREDEEDKGVRFTEDDVTKPQRMKIIDTEDVSRGPLSGIVRIMDSPRVIQRLQEREKLIKQKKEDANKPPAPTPVSAHSVAPTASIPSSQTNPYTPKKTGRQISEDEIDKIKKQNKAEESVAPSSSASGGVSATSPSTYGSSISTPRSPPVREEDKSSRSDRSSAAGRSSVTQSAASQDDDPSSYSTRRRDYSSARTTDYTPSRTSADYTPSRTNADYTSSRTTDLSPVATSNGTSSRTPSRKTSIDTGVLSVTQRAQPFSRSSSTSSVGETTKARSSHTLDTSAYERRLSRSNSTDSNRSYDGTLSPRKYTGAAFSTDELRNRFGRTTDSSSRSRTNTYPRPSTTSSSGSSRFQSRFLGRAGTPSAEASKESGNEEEEESSEETESDDSEESSEEEEEAKEDKTPYSRSGGGLLGRSTQNSSSTGSRTLGSSSTPTGRDDGGSSTAQLSNWARYLKNKYGNKSGGDSSAVGSTNSTGTSSSLLNRTGVSSIGSSGIGSSTSTSTARALARSRSSHLLGGPNGETSEDGSSKNADATPTFPAAAAGILVVPTAIGSIHRNQYLKKQHLLLQIGSRGSEPGNFTWPRGVAVGPDNSIVVADSSNHRVQVFDQNGSFQKEFGSYGSRQGEFDCLAGVAVNRIGQYIIADRYNHRIQVLDPSGMFLRSFGSQGSGDGRFSYPWGVTTDALGFIYVCDKENHRIQVFQSDGTFVGKFGSLGNKPGQLEHPHYIAVSSTNRVIVSDSNNHRIQIFDINGKVQTTFGGEGAEEGQFKFPRGVAVDEQGFIIVADSGNNRIQIFQADGSFVKAFGCWGSMEGEFKGMEGVAVTPSGNILVCDRENHRVQIF